MAQRFGGKYSPQGSIPNGGAQGDRQRDQTPVQSGQTQPHPFDGKAPLRGAGKARFLWVAALLFLPPAFLAGTPKALLFGLAASAMLMASAFMTREGIKAHAAYDQRKIARSPAIPRKLFGAVLAGTALLLGGLMRYPDPLYPALFGLFGGALHLVSFGLDPMRDKGAEGIDTFQTDRVARAVDEAERYLGAMKDAILRARDRQLEARVEKFTASARVLFRQVEDDPRDLTAARKYLSVYLMGARDATVKFADLFSRNRDPQARQDYLSLLDDLETNFADRSRRLLTDDRTDLDIEITVLRDRLKAEA